MIVCGDSDGDYDRHGYPEILDQKPNVKFVMVDPYFGVMFFVGSQKVPKKTQSVKRAPK